eukprot:09864.XXX_312268_310642_1 [CDS] Oithona nana genome sequencing.
MKDISSQESNLNLAQCLVVDLGTATTKSGWSNKSEPDFSIPSIVGHGRHKGAMLTLGLKDSYVGRQAQALQGILDVRQPFKQGCVQHWDDLELLWDHVWTQELKRIRLTTDSDTSDIKVLVSVPPLCPPEDWRKLAETFFEDKGIGGLYLANKSVLAMYGGGRTTGICVDTGEDMTYIVPCWEGTPLPNATIIQKLGGKHVTDRLLGLLSNGKYSFPDDTFLLLRGRGGRGFSVVSRRDVVKEAKERFCRVDPVNGLKSATKMEEQVLKLPDGNIVVVGDEATSAPELMFKPELAKCPQISGLHQLLVESLMRCEEKYRKILLGNIVLTGGNSLFPGFDKRLESEVAKLLPEDLASKVSIRVSSQKGRDNFTWKGGVHLCSLDSFQGLWLSQQDYMESGAKIEEGTVLEQANDLTV